MGDRITRKMLDRKLSFINKRMGRPVDMYSMRANHATGMKSNVGHLFIEQDNGYCLMEVSSPLGAIGSFSGNYSRLTGSCMWAVLDTIEAMLFLEGK